MSKPQEPMLDIARGDPARSKFLRESLAKLREHSKDPQFRSMVDDILAGRRSAREAATSEVFNRGIADKVEQGAQQYQALSGEEKEELAAQGEQRMAELREEIQRGNQPADPDPDDGDDGESRSFKRPAW
jgi:hypothetical protein